MKNSRGKKEKGSILANDETEAVRLLQKEKYVILDLYLKNKSLSKAGLSRGATQKVRRKKTVSLDDMRWFFDQMGTLLEASVDIIRALEMVAMHVKSEPLFLALISMKTDVFAGVSLADAMHKFPKIFPLYMRSLVFIGEQSGDLAKVMSQISINIEKSDSFRKKMVKSMIYPIVLISFSIFAISVFLLKVIPTFVNIFNSFDIEMPYLTSIIIKMSDILRSYILYIILVVFLLFIYIKKIVRVPKHRLKIDELVLQIPVLGELLLYSSLVAFVSSLHLMLSSGTTMLESLTLSRLSMKNLYLQMLIDKVRDRVKEGNSVSSRLKDFPIFPEFIVQMISIGEESGRLVDMLSEISKYYTKSLSDSIERFTVLIEPLIIVFVGGIIGVLVIGMFLPIFQLTNIAG